MLSIIADSFLLYHGLERSMRMWTPGITYKRARTRPAAGFRISSATTIDLASWTYYTVSYIIRTGAVKTAQDRVCAHGVDRRVGRDERPGEGCRPP